MKDHLFEQGCTLMRLFCVSNNVPYPDVVRLQKTDRLYHLASCAYYRPTTITIMVEKCASPGMGGMAWSWAGYAIDRTPYGVIQHELGHHVDHVFSHKIGSLFSEQIYVLSKEKQLTGYLGTDANPQTFFKEWFAENFRLFVTNPDMIRCMRPKFYSAITEHLTPVIIGSWQDVLLSHSATSRILTQAAKKTGEAIVPTAEPAIPPGNPRIRSFPISTLNNTK